MSQRGPKPKATAEQFIALRNEGKTWREIADTLGYASASSARFAATKQGVPVRARQKTENASTNELEAQPTPAEVMF